MNLRRGLLAGLSWGLAGLLGLATVIAAFTVASWWFNHTRSFDREYDIAWWQQRAFPGIVVIPMLLFFTGFTSYAPKRQVGFAKTFAILAVTSLPLAALLGAMGMAARTRGGMWLRNGRLRPVHGSSRRAGLQPWELEPAGVTVSRRCDIRDWRQVYHELERISRLDGSAQAARSEKPRERGWVWLGRWRGRRIAVPSTRRQRRA